MDQSPTTDGLSARTSAADPDATYSDESERQVSALRRKLRAQEEYLQTTNEELETTNEELKSSNEEMQSVNEELQSTNEELETSKEELQSVNEELATVNAELQTKVADLSRANNDMNNLLAGTGIGTVFVDHQLHILRFTPTVTRIINLIHTDIGRPVGHIVSNLIAYDNLVEDIQSVLNTLQPRDVHVQTDDKKWYTMRIQPYRTLENVIEGAVITFIEITEAKQAKDTIQNLLTEKETLLKEVHHRIKNNMYMITLLLAHQAETSADRAVISALTDAEGRVKSMMLLYNSLYRAPHYDRISVQDYIPSLVDDIVASLQNGVPLSVEKYVDDFVLDAKRLQPLGIIINELVTNAMKYAFDGKKGGTILVSVKLSGKSVVVSVQDDGVGIPESVDLEKRTGFGFVLVRLLTGQLEGSLRIEREHGTKITVEFEK